MKSTTNNHVTEQRNPNTNHMESSPLGRFFAVAPDLAPVTVFALYVLARFSWVARHFLWDSPRMH
jgi:hypothetical protein